MGIIEEDLIHVRRGALLHDIEKMGIPDNILLEAGPLTSDRPYWKAWSKDRTLKFIEEQSGRHFDPRVVEAFLKLIN